MPSALEMLTREYEELNSEWRSGMNQRRGVLNDMHTTIQDSEAAKMSPEYAGFLGAASGYLQPGGAAGGLLKARQAQAMLRDKARLGAMPDMVGVLGEENKQFSDLQRAVLGRLSSKESDTATAMAKRFYAVGSPQDGLVRLDQMTGDQELMVAPARFATELPKLTEAWKDRLIKGGKVDLNEIDNLAHQYAMKDISRMMGMHPFGNVGANGFESPVEIPGSTPAMTREIVPQPTDSSLPPEAQGNPVIGMNTEKGMRNALLSQAGADVVEGDSPGNVFGAPVGVPGGAKNGYSFDPVTNKYIKDATVPSLAKPVGRLPEASPTIKSAQQIETENKLAGNYADENTADRAALKDLRQMEQSRQVLSEIMASGKNTSGQAHELVNKLGGYLNYIDPSASLSKSVANDALYFSNMMNLTRDKIAALGSGTAVSNLDLIVTQKSVGDLRNTPEGNAKLLAIMELQNATMDGKLNGKLDHFDKAKSYDGYRGTADPSHMVRASRLPDGSTKYWVQTRQGWIDERLKTGDYKSLEAAERAFNTAATKATAALIRGTGIEFRRVK